MRGVGFFQKVLSTWVGWTLLILLSACMGGGGGAGGAGAPGAPDGGLSPVGGPLGGNPAAGPMPMPAPASISREVILARIFCKNIPGPMVECNGTGGSVPESASLRLTTHAAPQTSSPAIGSPVEFTANPDGSWAQMIAAEGGQFIRLCLMEGGNCKEGVFLPVPPTGGTVNGTQGIMNNLTQDADGYIIYSRLHRKQAAPRSRWSLERLFFGEAHAEESGGDLYMRGIGAALGSGIIRYQFQPPRPKAIIANCDPHQPADLGSLLTVVEGTRLAHNFASIRRIRDGRHEEVIQIPDATRDDIRDLAYFKFQVEGRVYKYLAAAANSKLYLIRDGHFAAPYIEYQIGFPVQFELSQLIEAGGYIYALLTPRDGGDVPAFPLYRVSFRDGEMYAMCIPPPAVRGIKEVVSLDTDQYKMAAVFRTGASRYQVVVGSAEILGDLTDFPLVSVFESDHPLEVKILGMDAYQVSLIVLDSVAKSLHTIHFPWAGESSDAELVNTSLESLGIRGLVYPRALSIDRPNRRLAFLGVQNDGSRVYTLNYSEVGEGNFALSSTPPTIYSLGTEAPMVLTAKDGQWYANSSDGSLRRVDQFVGEAASD